MQHNTLKSLMFFALIFNSFEVIWCQPYDVKKSEKVIEVFQWITASYVDTVDQEKISRAAIEGMLKKLDPHSVYIPREKVKEMEEPLTGNFEGVGIQFNILKDTILVVSPISGGPSEKLGILSGDKIIYIDYELVAGIGMTNKGVIKRLRGDKGSLVIVQIKRKGVDKLIEFEIIRDKIPIYSVDATYMINNHTGYIKLNKFSANTIEEFDASINALKEKGMKSLILDLTNNGGGYLQASLMLSDHFLSNNKLMLSVNGKTDLKDTYEATPLGAFEKGRVVVLIDEGSASASEIVSGAIQDNDRGLIVGRRSFGKGMVQKPIYLSDSSMIRLTIKRFYTPSGRCIQKPYEEGVEKYYEEIFNRYNSGELISEDSIQFPDSLTFKTVKGRTVYGGGGIMPDVFVPIDTTWSSDLYVDIARKGLQNQFCLDYVNTERERLLETYNDMESFKDNFKIDEDIEQRFLKFIEKEKIELDVSQYEKSRRIILAQLRALIARNLWNSTAYFYLMNEVNEVYLKAVELIGKEDFNKYLKD